MKPDRVTLSVGVIMGKAMKGNPRVAVEQGRCCLRRVSKRRKTRRQTGVEGRQRGAVASAGEMEWIVCEEGAGRITGAWLHAGVIY